MSFSQNVKVKDVYNDFVEVQVQQEYWLDGYEVFKFDSEQEEHIEGNDYTNIYIVVDQFGNLINIPQQWLLSPSNILYFIFIFQFLKTFHFRNSILKSMILLMEYMIEKYIKIVNTLVQTKIYGII